MTSDRVHDNLVALATAADREIDAAATRKASIEARALGIFTLALGVPTLYLLVRPPLHLGSRAGECLPLVAVWVGFIAAALALAAAIVVAWPVVITVLGPKDIQRLHRKVEKDVWMEGLLLQVRADVLHSANLANQVKGIALVVSLLTILLSVLAFGIGIVGSLPVTP